MNSRCHLVLWAWVAFLAAAPVSASASGSVSASGSECVRVAFYNVENYFDCVDDPRTSDEEFTPEGAKRWTWKRFWTKTDNLVKALTSLGQDRSFPDIFGLAEVENEWVVNSLIKRGGMKDSHRVIHRDSPDARGIDVCLVYNRYVFRPTDSLFLTVSFPKQARRTTRDLLYVKGLLPDGQPLHLIVSHWPSKSGGEAVSEPLRCRVAECIRAVADSILSDDASARLIIMGDFNDAPYEKSVSVSLGAVAPSSGEAGVSSSSAAPVLYDLMFPLEEHAAVKSYKYQGVWSMLDQMVVSAPLKELEAKVYHPGFLMTEDATYMGLKPARTYVGYRYQGGFSDHLPVYLDLPLLP